MVLASEMPSNRVGQRVQLDGVGVLGEVVLARDRPQHLGGALVGLLDDRLQLLRQFQIDCHDESFRSVR